MISRLFVLAAGAALVFGASAANAASSPCTKIRIDTLTIQAGVVDDLAAFAGHVMAQRNLTGACATLLISEAYGNKARVRFQYGSRISRDDQYMIEDVALRQAVNEAQEESRRRIDVIYEDHNGGLDDPSGATYHIARQ